MYIMSINRVSNDFDKIQKEIKKYEYEIRKLKDGQVE